MKKTTVDFCRWYVNSIGDGYLTQCTKKRSDDIIYKNRYCKKFRFCPYCGKIIKII